MTPDTTALRALVDTYVTGWYLTAAEVRALCDAADEVERLRAEVAAYTAPVCACGHLRSSHTPLDFGDCAECPNGTCGKYPGTKWDIWHRDTTLRAMRAEGDAVASRTAHAALIAELRALCDEWDEASFVYIRHVRALLDRHAPTTGATP